MEVGRALPALPQPCGQTRAAWLTRRSFQDRTDACPPHPLSVPRVINQRAFYIATSKVVKTGVCWPDPLSLRNRALRGLLVALNLKSHIQFCPLKGRHLLASLPKIRGDMA